jgi:restriction system protein
VRSNCIYCTAELENFKHTGITGFADGSYELSWLRELHTCNGCGWWIVEEFQRIVEDDWYQRQTRRRRAGALCNLDLTDITVPLSELRRYLSVRFDKVGGVPPARVERLVASVFREHGYVTTVTGRSGDGGIDILLLDKSDKSRIGVQVKRYKASIEAEQIQAFAGALLLNGLQRGVFVTTSRYRSGAARAAKRLGALQPFGLSIDLWDAERLLTELRAPSSPSYSGPDDVQAPFYPFFHGQESLVRYYEDWGYAP